MMSKRHVRPAGWGPPPTAAEVAAHAARWPHGMPHPETGEAAGVWGYRRPGQGYTTIWELAPGDVVDHSLEWVALVRPDGPHRGTAEVPVVVGAGDHCPHCGHAL